jgi:hypothetical protein
VEQSRHGQDYSYYDPFKKGDPVRMSEKEGDANYRDGRIDIRHDETNDKPCTRNDRANRSNCDRCLEAVGARRVRNCTPNDPGGCDSLRNQDSPKTESPRDRIEPYAIERGATAIESNATGFGFLIN